MATRPYFNDVILIPTTVFYLKFSEYCFLTSVLLNFQTLKISFLCSDSKMEQEMPGRNYKAAIHLHARHWLAIWYFSPAFNRSALALLFLLGSIVLYICFRLCWFWLYQSFINYLTPGCPCFFKMHSLVQYGAQWTE